MECKPQLYHLVRNRKELCVCTFVFNLQIGLQYSSTDCVLLYDVYFYVIRPVVLICSQIDVMPRTMVDYVI